MLAFSYKCYYQFEFHYMSEDRNLRTKQNRLLDNLPPSEVDKIKQATCSNIDDSDLGFKSISKFPQLKINKGEQNSLASKQQEGSGTVFIERRTTEGRNTVQTSGTYYGKKFNIKKKVQRKKLPQQQFKQETVSRFQQYINFISYINISNNIKITCQELSNPYVLYVGKGNNGTLIKNIFKMNRPWWVVEQTEDAKEINLHWYQLRQNNILEDFKEVNNIQFEKYQYYVDQEEAEEKNYEGKSFSETKNNFRSSQRSQSLVSKQSPSFFSRRVENPSSKRNSSISKNSNKSTQKTIKLSPSVKNHHIKELKTEVYEADSEAIQKKLFTNPKMWPIYFMYRKIFSAPDMKLLKKMGIIHEDGRIHGKLLRCKMRVIQNRSNNIKMHNHLENNWNLSNKKALFVNIRSYFQALKINPFQFIPMTFHVQKIGDKQFESFVEQYYRRCELIAQDQKNNKKSQYKSTFKPKRRNAWLIKPGQNTNRGNGIEVVQNLEQIKQIITKDNVDAEGRTRTHIIQQYIMPFLYQKRKFDIRCYILLTSVNGIQKGYWYQDGYIRTSCKQFNMKNLANRMIHLTNDAVQKKCEDYGKYEPGNKLSFSDFQRYLDSTYNTIQTGQKLKFWQQAYPQMKKLATDAIKSVYTKINPNKKQFSFQIFGLDFLIDQNFKVWLIEANTNPCLQLSSPLLGRMIPSMLENAFKIAVDPIFPPPPLLEINKMAKKVIMPQNPLESNKFQLVFDEIEQGTELKTLLTNTPDIHIYNIEEQEQQYEDQQNCIDS